MSLYSFKVASYNILSTNYCPKELFNKTDEKCLDTNYRWGLLKAKLEDKIKKGYVLCLQEVSLDWYSLLIPFFWDNCYFCINDNYGSIDSGHMGVLIAIPPRLKILKSSIIKPGEELFKLTQTKKPKRNKNRQSVKTHKKKKNRKIQHKRDDWSYTISKSNGSIFVKLQDNFGNIFCIATYHMPCVFDQTTVIGSHSTMLIQKLYELSDGSPFVFTGDFNTVPNNEIYQTITNATNKEINCRHLIQIPCKYDVKWDPIIKQGLSSAYKSINGKEPLYTNNTFTNHMTAQFTNTLDYLFYSEGLQVLSIDDLPTNNTQIYPNKDEPSDHIMIGAEFSLCTK